MTTTPGSIVSVTLPFTVTGLSSTYGLLAGVQVVLTVIAPPTCVAARVGLAATRQLARTSARITALLAGENREQFKKRTAAVNTFKVPLT